MYRTSNIRNLKINRCRKLSEYWTLSTATLFFCLSGCMGVYEGGFECPPGEGVGCKSISEVNAMVEQCSLPKAVLNTPCSACKIPGVRKQDSAIGTLEHPQEDELDPEHPSSSTPEIWYAPETVIDYSLIEA